MIGSFVMYRVILHDQSPHSNHLNLSLFWQPAGKFVEGKKNIQPRILCNGNVVLPHLQMGVAVMGFVEYLRYGLYDS